MVNFLRKKSWYKQNLSCHSKIRKSTNLGYWPQSSHCYKILKFMNFSKLPIGIETELDKLHFINWIQIKKASFLGLNFISRVNSKKWTKYTSNKGNMWIMRLFF